MKSISCRLRGGFIMQVWESLLKRWRSVYFLTQGSLSSGITTQGSYAVSFLVTCDCIGAAPCPARESCRWGEGGQQQQGLFWRQRVTSVKCSQSLNIFAGEASEHSEVKRKNDLLSLKQLINFFIAVTGFFVFCLHTFFFFLIVRILELRYMCHAASEASLGHFRWWGWLVAALRKRFPQETGKWESEPSKLPRVSSMWCSLNNSWRCTTVTWSPESWSVVTVQVSS